MNEFPAKAIEAATEAYDFETLFAHREKIDFYGDELELVDIHPEHDTSNIPVIIAPGWSETMDTFKDSIKTLVDGGRRVISFNHPRHGKEAEDMLPNGDSDIMEAYKQDAEIRKALAIIEILNERIPGKADVIAHSEGGINTAIAATFQAEKFNNIVFANAAGLMGPDNFPSLVKRFGLSVAKDTLGSIGNNDPERKTRGGRSLKETIKYIRTNFLRATEESGAISASEVDGVLKYLAEVGIGVIVVCGENDPVFPIDRVKETLKDVPIDHFIVMPGGHTEIVTDPEAYMGKILEKLNEMEKAAKS